MAKKETKVVHLPIASKLIFEAMAKAKHETEKDSRSPSKKSEQEMIDKYAYQYAKEAFLHSFTPSGEIGDNPYSARVAKSFYRVFSDILDPETGSLAKEFKKKKGFSATKTKALIQRIKASAINLVQVFIDMSPAFDLEANSYIYPKLKKGKIRSEDDYERLVAIEKNRYTRLFVTTVMMLEVLRLMNLDTTGIEKTVIDSDLLGDEKFSNRGRKNSQKLKDPFKRQFAHLRNPETRENFIRKVMEAFEIKYGSEVSGGKVRFTQEQTRMDID